ncbi:MAG: RluA family pseudouridine synthase [Candidatus Onthovivens sp.]|nr:RluA family pseudouridine synthase [Candidatus Onthovivens sp.]
MKEIVISNEFSNQRVDKYVRKYLNEAPLSFIYKLFRKKDVKVNNHWVKENYLLQPNDVLRIYVTDEQLEEFNKPKVVKNISFKDLDIVYEDKNILIINKPKGILVHGDINEKRMTLTNKVQSYILSKGEQNDFLCSPVHRLDRNTSGLVIFAKNFKSSQYFMGLLKEKEQIEKYYLCLVVGKMEGNGTISIPLYKDESRGMVFKGNIKDGAKEAITKYNVIGTNNEYSLVEVQILTGRTHQIRAHFKEINHPLVGDGKYGDFKINKEFNSEFNYDSQFLHAYKIKFSNLEGDFKYLSKKVFVSPLNNKEKEILNKLNIPMKS